MQDGGFCDGSFNQIINNLLKNSLPMVEKSWCSSKNDGAGTENCFILKVMKAGLPKRQV
jgi:hypothetical protein